MPDNPITNFVYTGAVINVVEDVKNSTTCASYIVLFLVVNEEAFGSRDIPVIIMILA